MISYNWSAQQTMMKVRNRLKAAGYKVWMDIDNMSMYLSLIVLQSKSKENLKVQELACLLLQVILLPPANEVWGKVIFSETCVKNSVHKGGCLLPWGASSQRVPPLGRGVPGGDLPGRLLLRAVRILLECILVCHIDSCVMCSHHRLVSD